MRLSRAFIALCCFLARAGAGVAAEPTREMGHPLLQNYTPGEYQAHNQNWVAVQDAQGVMYFGNQYCVLSFDGVTWRKIAIPDTLEVHGLAIDPKNGTIFVAANRQLGYLKNNADGSKSFVSLLDQLPADARDVREVWRAYETPEGIVFVSAQQVMRWHDGRFRVWKIPNPTALHSACSGGQVYIEHVGAGLERLEGDGFVPVVPPGAMPNIYVTAMLPEADGSVLLCSMRHGMFSLRDGVLTALSGDTDEFFKAKEIRQCIRLRDGSLAVATGHAGVVLLDKDRHFVSRSDETSGIQHETILNLFEDREGGLWLCLYSGVTRIEIASPVSAFDTVNGLGHTTVLNILRVDGILFMATASGIYRLVEADAANHTAAYCERVPGPDHHYSYLCKVDGGFAAGSLDGLTFFDSKGGLQQDLAGKYAIRLWHSPQHPERVFYCTMRGLYSVRRDVHTGQWVAEGLVPGTDSEDYTVEGAANGVVWIGTNDAGVMRITFAESGANGERGAATVTKFFKQPGPVGEDATAYVLRWDGDDVFTLTGHGIYRFDEKDRSFHEVAGFDPRLWKAGFDLENLSRDADGALWAYGHAGNDAWTDRLFGRADAARENGGPGFRSLPSKIIAKTGGVQSIFVEGSDAAGKVLWVSGAESVVRVDTRLWTQTGEAVPALATRVRRAESIGDNGRGGTDQAILDGPLPYRNNTVHFDLAADTFAYGADPQYQTRLVGLGSGRWSEFSRAATAAYTNLAEGAYSFEARARDADGRLATVARVPFRILPPWERTPWAYLIYVLAGVAAVAGIVRWRMRRLRLQNARLESVVAARTGELRAHEAELVRAKEAADAANHAKSAFLANMSHELRTPLNAILGYTQILLKDRDLSARNRERVTVVGQSGGHLLAMINEVLDLSKIEAGKLTLNRTDFSLGQLLDDVCAVCRPRFAEKGLDFRCVLAVDLPDRVHTDSDKLRQVLFNLLGNSAKFTRHGEVRCEVASVGADRVRFEVVDTGIGIAAEELRDIFLAFHQAGGNGLASQGTGLGLAISQRFVELLGGKLEVESTLGGGSRFWFELTLPTAATGGAPVVANQSVAGQHTIIGYEGAPRRLLIADDEPLVRSVLRELLEPLGFVVEEVTDGEQCLDRCLQHPPDLLLLDLRMQGLDGFGVARALRRQEVPGATLKIIAVSASVFEVDRQQAIAAGCDDFLPKPFKEEHLLATLGQVLGLQWIFGPGAGQPGGSSFDGENAPSADEIDAMLELSRRGDILGIKKRLGALGSGPFVRGLEPLVASYQMDRIRDVLVKCKDHGNG